MVIIFQDIIVYDKSWRMINLASELHDTESYDTRAARSYCISCCAPTLLVGGCYGGLEQTLLFYVTIPGNPQKG